MILTHVFSLRKDNRHLQRRIKNFEDKYQERKLQKQKQVSLIQSNVKHSRNESNITDRSAKNFDTENSIELYPELGPNTPLIKYEVDQAA